MANEQTSTRTNYSNLTVLIPTWRRPESLVRCLIALAKQTRPANQIVVTVREDDSETWSIIPQLQKELGAVLQTVTTPPVRLTDAMNAGLARTTGDLVALTDDDAEPHPDWLEKLETIFTDPKIGGGGGRDWQPRERWDEPIVGRLSWYGRVVGNHHLGCGRARKVELLKGVNCCFRGDVLRRIGFDKRLRGRGNVCHWEMSLCFAFLREGYELIYDPCIAVDHHIAPRHDGDTNDRGVFDRQSYIDIIHNESLATLEALPRSRRWVYRLWRSAVGTIATPGVVQVLRRCIVKREAPRQVWQRFLAAREGMRLALVTARQCGGGYDASDHNSSSHTVGTQPLMPQSRAVQTNPMTSKL